MGKDCGRGNEQLDAKHYGCEHVAKGEVRGSKISQDFLVCVSL